MKKLCLERNRDKGQRFLYSVLIFLFFLPKTLHKNGIICYNIFNYTLQEVRDEKEV